MAISEGVSSVALNIQPLRIKTCPNTPSKQLSMASFLLPSFDTGSLLRGQLLLWMGVPLGYVGPAVILGCTNKMSQEPRKMKVNLSGSCSLFRGGLCAVRCWHVSLAVRRRRNSLQCLSGMLGYWCERVARLWDGNRPFKIPIVSSFWHDSWHDSLPAEFRVVWPEIISLPSVAHSDSGASGSQGNKMKQVVLTWYQVREKMIPWLFYSKTSLF